MSDPRQEARELAERTLDSFEGDEPVGSGRNEWLLARELLSALDALDRYEAAFRELGIDVDQPPEEVFEAFRRLHGVAR